MFVFLDASYDIYDGFVFPSNKKWDRISYYSDIAGVNPKNAWEHALEFFLQKYKIQHNESEDFDIVGMWETIREIYFQMKRKKFISFNGKQFISFSDTEQFDRGLRKVCVNACCTIIILYYKCICESCCNFVKSLI